MASVWVVVLLLAVVCIAAPVKAEVCSLPKISGPCRAAMPRYFYNNVTKQCQTFIYGGCKGNANNFENIKDCQETCTPPCVVCMIYCQFGNVMGKDGCPLCQCKPTPCIYAKCSRGYTCIAVKQTCPKGVICNLKYQAHCIPALCALPKKVGPCEALISRYFYNAASKKCDKFDYGGCDGNDNNFKNLWDCRHACEDPCNQPLDPGPCKAYLPRYFYNSTSHTCNEFVYGGCGGSANNFQTLQDCQQTCNADLCVNYKCPVGKVCKLQKVVCVRAPCPPVPSCVKVCTLPKDPGPCKAAFQRYFYNSGTKQCEQFTYGGCQGNANNFKKMEDCQKICKSPCSTHKCPMGQTCQVLPTPCIVPPCPIVPTCVKVCTLPKDPGPCKASLPRYFYNSVTRRCEKFTYGGCKGNANNFENIKACQKTCKPPCIVCAMYCKFGNVMGKDGCPLCQCKPTPCAYVKCSREYTCIAVKRTCPKGVICNSLKYQAHCIPALCALPKDVGPCGTLFPRYFYNVTAQKCDKFYWGGCKGNDNNFKTFWDCRHACEDPCNKPKVKGPCLAYMPRYFYNISFRTCDKFIYGGCLGNANNFISLHDCQETCNVDPCANHKCPAGQICQMKPVQCKKKPCHLVPTCIKVCTLPKDPGPCKAAIPRYFYSSGTKQCEKFIYGGCKGNANNFRTIKDCQKACKLLCIVCLIYCEFGNVMGKDGCPLCQCKSNPCISALCQVGYKCVAVKHTCSKGDICASRDYRARCIEAVKKISTAGRDPSTTASTTTIGAKEIFMLLDSTGSMASTTVSYMPLAVDFLDKFFQFSSSDLFWATEKTHLRVIPFTTSIDTGDEWNLDYSAYQNASALRASEKNGMNTFRNKLLQKAPNSLTNLGQTLADVKTQFNPDSSNMVIVVSDFINIKKSPDFIASMTALKNSGAHVFPVLLNKPTKDQGVYDAAVAASKDKLGLDIAKERGVPSPILQSFYDKL